MKKRLKRCAFALLLLIFAIPTLAVVFTRNAPDPVDLEMLVEVDGETWQLGDLVQAYAEVEKLPGATPTVSPILREALPDGSFNERSPLMKQHRMDLYDLAMEKLTAGEVDTAVALLRSVPKGSRRYSRAQRFIGWEICTRMQDDPNAGLAYMTESLRAEPFSGNAWQDMYRVSLRSLVPGFLR